MTQKKNYNNQFLTLIFELLEELPKRNQIILEKRFGLKNNSPKTLEAIGKEYKITRERVRQIINASFNNLRKSPVVKKLDNFYQQVKNLLLETEGIAEAESFIKKVQKELSLEDISPNIIFFLLNLNPEFSYERENDECYSFFHLSSLKKEDILKKVKKIEKFFDQSKQPLTIDEIILWAKKEISPKINRDELVNLMGISKKIAMNPFGEFGLINWRSINPVASNDRAYYLLSHLNRPVHFTELSNLLAEYCAYPFLPKLTSRFWQKKVCAQTIHNELIKDPRFVLVGRGTYALKEWGYEKNNIKDVIQDILFNAQKPLSFQDIVNETKKRKIVKEKTILLSLSDKECFKKLPDGAYTLTEESLAKIKKKQPQKSSREPKILEG